MNLNIQCDHATQPTGPNIIVVNKVERSCSVTDITLPQYEIHEKQTEKAGKHQDLEMEVKRL